MAIIEQPLMDQAMLEQSLRKMWQDIQILQKENQRLRECLIALDRWDLVNAETSNIALPSPLPQEKRTIPAQPSYSSLGLSTQTPSPTTKNSNISLMRALGGNYPTRLEPSETTAPSFAARQSANIDIGLVRQLTVEQLNNLPYGVVTTDRDGIVLSYNDTESRLAGVPKEKVLMRNFFKDVAPCTQVKEFEGRFQSFARGESRAIEQFDFVFNLASGTQYVTIIFTPGRARGTINIIMTRR